MKTVQFFTDEYLEECKKLTPDQIIKYLEDYRNLHYSIKKDKSKLISMKVPESMLRSFKTKAQLKGQPYQSIIKELMIKWLSGDE